MNEIQTDIAAALFKAIEALEQKNSFALVDCSNMTVHNATVFQDKDSINAGVMLYALSKVLREKPELADQFLHLLIHAYNKLKHDDVVSYRQVCQEILDQISHISHNLNKYIQHFIETAKVKKGSSLYYHGLSIAQSASVSGTSQWELYNYVGKTTTDDRCPVSPVSKNVYKLAKALQSGIVVLDAGPIITLTSNNLLSMLEKIKTATNCEFFIPQGVKQEVIGRPLQTHKYKYEAFQVISLLHTNIIQNIEKSALTLKAQELGNIINNCFFAFNKPVEILHGGELESLALCLLFDSHIFVVDEFTTRMVLFDPLQVKNRLESRLHTSIVMDEKKVQAFAEQFRHLLVVRSVELMIYCYLQDYFASTISALSDYTKLHNDKHFLEGLLWGLKLSGCSVSENEINKAVSQFAA